MEHIRLNGAYWGLTTLDLLHKLHAVDSAEVVEWILSCYHPESGTPAVEILLSFFSFLDPGGSVADWYVCSSWDGAAQVGSEETLATTRTSSTPSAPCRSSASSTGLMCSMLKRLQIVSFLQIFD
jgi:hypothetical protein